MATQVDLSFWSKPSQTKALSCKNTMKHTIKYCFMIDFLNCIWCIIDLYVLGVTALTTAIASLAIFGFLFWNADSQYKVVGTRNGWVFDFALINIHTSAIRHYWVSHRELVDKSDSCEIKQEGKNNLIRKALKKAFKKL